MSDGVSSRAVEKRDRGDRVGGEKEVCYRSRGRRRMEAWEKRKRGRDE